MSSTILAVFRTYFDLLRNPTITFEVVELGPTGRDSTSKWIQGEYAGRGLLSVGLVVTRQRVEQLLDELLL
jgi:FMN-dependent NADH-azoreductase